MIQVPAISQNYIGYSPAISVLVYHLNRYHLTKGKTGGELLSFLPEGLLFLRAVYTGKTNFYGFAVMHNLDGVPVCYADYIAPEVGGMDKGREQVENSDYDDNVYTGLLLNFHSSG